VLAVAAGIAVCAVAAGIFVLTRQDTPASASSPGAGSATTAVGTAPGDAALSPMPGASEGMSAPGASGRTADGAADGEVDGDASRPEVSSSAAADGRRNDPSTPGAEPNAPADTPQPPSSPSADPATPLWVSDCTHYSGNGRTRQGDSGKRVLQVQCILTKRGYGGESSGVDGNFGPATESAVRSFQSDKGLDANGEVHRETWIALRSSE
jgi:hypothetical protein